MTNVFWLGANIIFDLSSGNTSRVLMFVGRREDASVFSTASEAENYMKFVQARASDIHFEVEDPTPQRPRGYIIRGVQTVG